MSLESSLPLYSPSISLSRSPPYYSPPPPPPCYSQDPADDETRIDFSPRNRRRSPPSGIFTKACGSSTVILFNQEPNIRVPSYCQHGPIRGSLIIEEDTSQIREVVAKLEGRLEVTTTDFGVQATKVVKQTYCLWSSQPGSSSVFPGTVDIACDFPATFQHQGRDIPLLPSRDFPLPPSYVARFPGFPALFVKCTYSLTISITKGRRLGFSKTKLIYVPIEYNPQTFPAHGMPPILNFLSSVKTIPEEWHQTSFIMNTRYPNMSPIQCQAFIPSTKVFGLSDIIPVHVQLSGSLASLRQLVLPLDPSCESDRRHSPVRVYLTRKVTFEYRGRSTWRVQRIGEGHFPPLPPVVKFECSCEPACDSCDSCVEALDWDGEVRCDADVVVGGFQAAGLTVKDLITVEIIPPNTAVSPLRGIQHAIPIRLVTDTFVEPT
ncbi:hypothetical protein B0H14DRAFT_2936571 [Mycena olivaceomarginata]|nr:hypothetical protein B0H14DRAFT_2936571 [Mycena olivaceomarginata]